MNEKAKKYAFLLSVSIITIQNAFGGWFDIQPAYDATNDVGTIRLEGVGEFAEKWSHYGFIDFNGSPNDEWDLDVLFMEQTLRYSLMDLGDSFEHASLALEVDAGTGFSDVYRFGLTWGKSLWEGNHTGIKALALASRDDNALASLFISQDFTDRFSMYMVFDYGFGDWIFGENQTYLEIEAKYELDEHFSVFIQGRDFRATSDWGIDLDTIVGMKVRFLGGARRSHHGFSPAGASNDATRIIGSNKSGFVTFPRIR